MNEQYNKLGKSLFFFYASRMIALSFIFVAVLAFINNFYTSYINAFPDESSLIKFDRMVNLLELSKSAVASIAKTTEMVVLQNQTSPLKYYCTSNQSESDCQSLLFNSLDNQLIYKTYGLLPSFRCLMGSCSRVSLLWDYFWTFSLRLRFIDYMIVEYNLNQTGDQLLIAPVSLNEPKYNYSSNQTSAWRLFYDNNLLALSMMLNISQLTMKVTLVYNTSILRNQYFIQISDYEIYPRNVSPTLDYLTYAISDTLMFGYLPSSPSFLVNTWFYNLMLILVCITCVMPLTYIMKKIISNWQVKVFRYIQSLDNLYKYQINSIFKGEEPKKSVIFSETNITFFFEDLSQVIDKECEPLVTVAPAIEKEETFKFNNLIDRVMNKFEESLKSLEEQRAHEFTNLKPLIRTSINEISDSVNKKLREIFIKSRQLMLTPQFFYFGYLSLLNPTPLFESLLVAERTPLPDAMISVFRYMNHTVNSSDLKFAFKFAFAYNHIIEQQIIMKLQDNLLQKYLSSLKDLDAGDPNYATKLNLKKRLSDLEKTIDNKRHIFSVYLK